MPLFQYSIPKLADTLQFGDGMVDGLYHAADIIVQYCTPHDNWAIEPLLSALRRETDLRPMGFHVASVVDAPGVVGDERVVEPLILQLAQDDWVISDKAARALGELGYSQSTEPLCAALDCHNGGAAHALAALQVNEAADRLVELLEYSVSSLHDNTYWEQLAESNSNLPEEELMELLGLEQDQDFAQREWVADLILSLGKLGTPLAMPVLSQQFTAYGDDPEISVLTAISLLRLSDQRGRPLVVEAAFDSMSNWSVEAARCLVKMHDPTGLDARQSWYEHEDTNGRNAIIKWFSRHGDELDIPFLEWILRTDEDMTSFGWTIPEITNHAVSRIEARTEVKRLSIY